MPSALLHRPSDLGTKCHKRPVADLLPDLVQAAHVLKEKKKSDVEQAATARQRWLHTRRDHAPALRFYALANLVRSFLSRRLSVCCLVGVLNCLVTLLQCIMLLCNVVLQLSLDVRFAVTFCCDAGRVA
jgi:hypothetical protein